MHIEYWWESQKERGHLEDSIKIYIREIGWDGMDWINLAQDKDE
jgi:hypothetical protein